MGQREMVLGTCWELGKHARKLLGTKMGNLVRTIEIPQIHPLPPSNWFLGVMNQKIIQRTFLKQRIVEHVVWMKVDNVDELHLTMDKKNMDNEQFLHPLNENQLPIFQHAQTQIMCLIL
jgi:hypothetical protein